MDTVPARGLSALALLLAVSCGRADGTGAEHPNVILISVDTLRADAISPYGGPVPTPAFERLAREGVVFEQAYATAPTTASSHASLFLGREVLDHGVVRNGKGLAEDHDTLAELFRSRGYATGAFASSFVLDPRFGWDQGFDHYDAHFTEEGSSVRGGTMGQHEYDVFDRRAAGTIAAAKAWLRDAPEPFFLFVHLFDPHAPYAPPVRHAEVVPGDVLSIDGRAAPGVSQAELAEIVRLYHAEVLFVDEALTDLLAAVDAYDPARETLVALTADHGEGLGQHRWVDHAVHLYEELLRVPLVFWWRDRSLGGRRVQAPVSLVDVAPTITALAGLPGLPDATGRSLAASVERGAEPEPAPILAYRRRMKPQPPEWRAEKLSVRVGKWKYVRTTDVSEELFDLERDPGETENLAAEFPEEAARLAALLDAHRAGAPEPGQDPGLSEDVLEGLRALGYTE